MDAEITVRFIARNLCSLEDLRDHTSVRQAHDAFAEIVRYLIQEEGLFGIVEDDPEILSITEKKA